MNKIRGHHFNLGTSNPSFLTTSAATYGSHPLGQSKSTGKIGQDLRTAHFDLGKESTPFVTTHQMDFTKKVARDVTHRPEKELILITSIRKRPLYDSTDTRVV